MNVRSVCSFLLVVLTFGLLSLVRASGAGKIYSHLVIKAFDTPGGTELPADFAQMLRRNLKIQLGNTNRFRNITVLEKGDPAPTDADLELSGTITRFQKGSAAKRLVPGLGATRINAIMDFKELPSGQTLYTCEVSGKVAGRIVSADPLGATNGLAKDVAKIVNKKLR